MGTVTSSDNVVSHPIVLYDGVCGLCNRMVQFVLRRDRAGIFRFAWLQSDLAQRVLARHGVNAASLDAAYVVVNCDAAGNLDAEMLLARSDAVLFVARELGGVWRALAWGSHVMPRVLREWLYRVVASNRYRLFGQYEVCPLPDEAVRERFLDL